ncbi:hypothetical protein [Nodosilinea nodulosa]|uniref:GspE/PulE/PilB domain-containing protein n=1 Tax=Nodosilinea nodulosa TaxID=416001 RepID=UPI00030CFA60|nr:hypothetical protein [Nodosilinea nodulosa]
MPKSNTYEPPHDLSALDVQSGIEAVDSRLNTAQMLSLIDSIFPFEACLYHEIIPLSVESSCLYLGMVSPTDPAALDFARRQVSFIHCSLVPLSVAADWQRNMLSKYLSHSARTKPQPQPANHLTSRLPTVADDELMTFIVDSPDDIQNDRIEQTAPAPRPAVVSTAVPASQPLDLTLDADLGQIALDQFHLLPPAKLTQALLKQVLTEGIGRLYLEQRPTHGRVLWSKDGVVQAALTDLSTEQVQSIINELKRLTHLPLLPTSQPKQADIERLYKGDRVLLRLRLIVGAHGEEATLQVLRGAALKFYEQQQLRQMGEEALTVAHALQKRISNIRQQAMQTLTIETPSARTLDDLMQLLKTMEEQIEQIIESSAHSESGQ